MYAFEEHVGEVRLRVDAPTLAGLFEEAARALCELVHGDSRVAGDEVRVRVSASDRAALLVEWLNELVYQSEARKIAIAGAHVTRIDERELEATIRAAEPTVVRTAVKAATMHDVSVDETAEGWTARVVLDV